MEDEAPDEDFGEVIALAADTLRGDIRDSIMSWVKGFQKPWHEMSEGEQRDFADASDRFATALIKEACSIIAAGERPCFVATLTEYREKEGIEAKLKLASKGEIVAGLHEACGREVLVVTSGAEDFMGQSGEPEITADQPELEGIGEEYRDAA